MNMEQSLPDIKSNAEKVSQGVGDLTPEQQALLMRWLEDRPSKSESPEKSHTTIPRVSQVGDMPLSFAQQRLWFLDQLRPGSAAYNLGYAIRLSGPLDAGALRRTFAALVARHESLRTTFKVEDGEPRQVIALEAGHDLTFTDLDHLEASRREEEVRRLCAVESLRPFDLSAGPLMRTTLLRLSADEHVLLFTMHHIISDAWSMGVLVREVGVLYGAYARGLGSPLAELPIQYADYAAWQRGWLKGEALEAQLSYWRRQMAGAPPVLELPTDRARSPARGYASARRTCEVGAELSGALRRVGRGEGATLFMVLLAGFAALLSRHAGQEEVVIGTPIAGRTEAETEGLIGVFINALALRVNLEGDPTFQELLRRVKAVTLGAYEHQALPFEKLVEELTTERDMRYTPLFQVALVLQNTPMTPPKLSDLRLSTVELDTRLTKYEMTVTVEETESGLAVTFEYARDLFEGETMERMLGHWLRLLTAAGADPGLRLSQLPLLTEAEGEQLEGWNRTAEAWASGPLLHELFEGQAARTPDAAAVVFAGGQLTYAELNERAEGLAHHLADMGVSPEVVVGIMTERSPEMVIALLGVLKAGGAYVPLDPAYPRERLAFMLEDSRAQVLLTQERLLGQLPEYEGLIVGLDAGGRPVTGLRAGKSLRRAWAENLAYVIYTSGSTGRPKGVMVSHGAIANRLLWMQGRFPLGGTDAVLQKTTLSFDASVWELFSPLLAGARLELARAGGERDAAYLAAAVAERGVTVLQLVPSMLRAWVEEEGAARCAGLRRLFCGGEALGAELAGRFGRLLGAELVNLYGPTETSIDATFWPCRRDDEVDGAEGERGDAGGVTAPIGRPISNVEVHVLDGLMRQVPVGVAGELYVGGAGLARGYLNRPGLTAEKFVPDPFKGKPGARLYRTGDVGRRLADGSLEYLGRADAQVKVRGYRIELGEVEVALKSHAGVGECVVTAREEAGGHKRLVAYVVPTGGPALTTDLSGPTADGLRAFLEAKLPGYMVPSAFVMLAALPLAPNGKLDRRALPAPEPGHAASPESYQAPRTLTEKLLAEVWAEVLGVERVGVNDNFFALGGDSIRSIQVRALARKRGLKFSLPQLFRHQSILELAPETTIEAVPAETKLARPFDLVSVDDRARLPRDLEDAYPLSALQMGMIFHSELTSEDIYQNIRSYKLRAQFDARALEAAIGQVIARHPALRTSFDLSTYSEPLQLVHRRVETPLVVHDMRQLSPAEQDAVMADSMQTEKARHFDWRRAPLVRFAVHLVGDDVFQFTMAEHHAVIDGWSVATLLTELFKLYLSMLGGEAPAVEPAPPASFRDYVMLEREALQSEDSRRYWDGQLASGTVTRLPRWSPLIESDDSWEAANLDHTFPPEVTEGVGELARSLSVSIKSVLLAAHLKVMSFLSGQASVVTGLVMNGRLEEGGGDKVLGLFLNTLPLQLNLPQGTWADLIRETFAAESLMLPHRRYPMAELQKRRPGHPLFETAFNFTHFHVFNSLEAFDEVEVLDVNGFGETNFTLLASFNVNVVTSQINLLFGYNRSEIPDEQVLAMGEYYERALALMTSDPQARHDSVTLLSDDERRRQLYEWNATAADYPRGLLLHELFERQVQRTPARVALVFADERLSYAELDGRAEVLAGRLRGLGVGPEAAVGVLMERGVGMVVALLGVLKAGGAYVPLDPEYPRERIEFMLADSGASVLLTQRRLGPRFDWLDEGETRVVRVDDGQEEGAASAGGGSRARRAAPENVAYVIYTSGSTGRPKGVVIEHRNAVAFLCWARDFFSEEELAGVLASTSVCFDLSVFELFAPLSCGGSVILMRDALHLPEGAAASEVALINTVPSVMAELAKTRGVPDSVRAVILAGEPLPEKLVQEIYERKTVNRVINLYGPTEDTTYSTGALMERDGRGKVLIGRPITNRQAYILDERMRPTPVGAPGELHLGGAGLARGYLGRPGLTAEKFVPNPFGASPGARLYKTGDVARYMPDGQIDYLGRRDNQVKLRGFRIELSEVETVLCRHEKVRAAAVLAREDVPGDRRLVAYVVAAGGAEADAGELRSYVRGRLPEHMVPSAFVQMEELPLTSNGKLDRRALPAPGKADLESRKAYTAPRNPVEAQLVEMWEEVIGVSPVGIADDFFELGGHSLSAIRLMARVEKHFGRKLPLSVLVHAGSVARMAEALSGERTRRPSPAAAIQPAGLKRPFFCVHPSGGGVLCYVGLSRHLGSDRPFYGLQDPILDGAEYACDSVPRMAADYLEALRAVQPEGPYLLGGYSFGGVVAFEMAQQLLGGGAEVAALVMLDSMSPVGGKQMLELEDLLGVDDGLILYLHSTEHARQMGKQFSVPTAELSARAADERLLYVFEEVKKAGLLPPEIGLPDVRRYVNMHRARRQAIQSYACEPYGGRVTLFRTSEPPHAHMEELSSLFDARLLGRLNDEQMHLFRQPFYGWDELSAEPVEVYPASGNHDTLLLEPNVRQLGARLARRLDETEPGARGHPPTATGRGVRR